MSVNRISIKFGKMIYRLKKTVELRVLNISLIAACSIENDNGPSCRAPCNSTIKFKRVLTVNIYSKTLAEFE